MNEAVTSTGTSLARFDAVHRFLGATAAATTVESIYEAALDALISALSVDRASLSLSDAAGVTRTQAERGQPAGRRVFAPEGHSLWPQHGPSAVPRAIVIPDLAADGTLEGLQEGMLGEGVRSVAFIPMLYGRRLLGHITVACDRPRRFSAPDMQLATTVASHVACALEQRRVQDDLRCSAETLAATLNAVGEGITVQSPEGKLLFANQAAATMLGYESVPDMLAGGLSAVRSRFDLLDGHGDALDFEQLPGRAALRGDEPPERLVRWRVVATGEEHFSLVRSHPVRDGNGDVRFAVNLFRDVTEHQRALAAVQASEARLAFLAAAGRRLLAAPLDPDQVLGSVVDLLVPELADWCTVREITDDDVMQRIAVGHRDRAAADLVARLESYGDTLAGSPSMLALLQGQSILVPEVTDELLEGAAVDAEHLDLLRRLDLASVMLVPLRTRGRTTGILTLAGDSGRRRYSEGDLTLVEEVASRAAATVDNAQSFAREHATAETLARALLPGRLPQIPGLELSARYRAAGDVGGDFYDCFPVDTGGWMVVVGDVCGRGIHAASMTGLTRHTIRAAALHASSPAAVLVDLNRLLLDAAEEKMAAWLSSDDAEPGFCTVCLAQVTPTPSGATVTVAVAGHPLPLVVRSDGRVAEVGRPGSLVGVLSEIEATDQSIELRAGDALVLFTDGITERRREGVFLADELAAILTEAAGRPAMVFAQHVEDAAVAFAAAVPDDDMAVVVVSVPATVGAGDVGASGERDRIGALSPRR